MTLRKVSKTMWLVIGDGNRELGTIEKIGRNSAWNAFHGVGPSARFVGTNNNKQQAVRMAIDGVRRDDA